jgi:hypothetical protein
MKFKRVLHGIAIALALVGITASIAAAACQPPGGHMGHGGHGVANLGPLRAVTAKYHSTTVAEHHGYAKFSDINGISCIAQPGMGAMGVHYVNGDLVNNPAIVASKPEAMVYSPDRSGKLHLAAVEYIVVKSAWDATHKHPPMLYGQMFMTTDAPNRYGLPTFYSLHVWAWKHNPAGTFAMWNPNVHCPVM